MDSVQTEPLLIELLSDYSRRLFPLCRSLTGPGVRETLRILQEIVPWNIYEIPSGNQVGDWVIPNEWSVRDAYVMDSSGKRVIDFQQSNLHLVGYSIPFEGVLPLESLQEHLFSLPEQPDLIPYVTSYYQPRWGFCLTQRERNALKPGLYMVKVDTTLEPGSLTYADYFLPGKSEKEVFLSSYICHPSMANNELSGPLVAAFVAKALQEKPRRLSYRIALVPETIGALAYLSRHLPQMQRNVIGGYVLTCLGDRGGFSYLKSRWGDRVVDRLTPHVLKHAAGECHLYDWLQRGSDERQYCWPGVNLPMGCLMRTKYGEYPEYHTSGDNLDFICPVALAESVQMTLRCLDAFEQNICYQATTMGEPQLGKRGLYPTLSTRDAGRTARTMVNLLAYSDGETDLLAIAEKLQMPIWELHQLVPTLCSHQLLKANP